MYQKRNFTLSLCPCKRYTSADSGEWAHRNIPLPRAREWIKRPLFENILKWSTKAALRQHATSARQEFRVVGRKNAVRHLRNEHPAQFSEYTSATQAPSHPIYVCLFLNKPCVFNCKSFKWLFRSGLSIIIKAAAAMSRPSHAHWSVAQLKCLLFQRPILYYGFLSPVLTYMKSFTTFFKCTCSFKQANLFIS